MNVIRFVSLVLIAGLAGVSGCSMSPLIGYPGYGDYPPSIVPAKHQQYLQVETMANRYFLGTRNPDGTYTAHMGSPVHPNAVLPEGQAVVYRSHDDNWMVGGMHVPRRLVVMSHVPQGFDGRYQPQVAPFFGLNVAPIDFLDGETAAVLLGELEAGGNPCTTKNYNSSVTVGSVVGGLGVGLLTMSFRGLVAGALVGGWGGSREARWNCSAYTNMRAQFLVTVARDKPRCRDSLSQVQINGQLNETLTRECTATAQRDFKRIGQGQPQAVPAARLAPPAAPQRRLPAPKVEEDLPPK